MKSDWDTRFDRVLNAYQARACFVCGHFGGCRHREYEVEVELIEADLRRFRVAAA